MISDAAIANRFLTELVESRGLRLDRLEETAAGGLRIDGHDPVIGPLFGWFRVSVGPPSKLMCVEAAIDYIERSLDDIAADEGRVPNEIDIPGHYARQEAAAA